MIYIAITLAIIGTYLVAEPNKKSRLYGFSMYLISNSIWIAYGASNNDQPTTLQFSIFLLLTCRGIKNNINSPNVLTYISSLRKGFGVRPHEKDFKKAWTTHLTTGIRYEYSSITPYLKQYYYKLAHIRKWVILSIILIARI